MTDASSVDAAACAALGACQRAGVLLETDQPPGAAEPAPGSAEALAHHNAPTLLLDALLSGTIMQPSGVVVVQLDAEARRAVAKYLHALLCDEPGSAGAMALARGCEGAARLMSVCGTVLHAQRFSARHGCTTRLLGALEQLHQAHDTATLDMRRLLIGLTSSDPIDSLILLRDSARLLALVEALVEVGVWLRLGCRSLEAARAAHTGATDPARAAKTRAQLATAAAGWAAEARGDASGKT